MAIRERCLGRPRLSTGTLLAAAAIFAGSAGFASTAGGQAGGSLQFADWTSVQGNTATGALLGAPISLSGSHLAAPPASRVDGTGMVFNQPFFSPPLATSDVIELFGFQGYSYVLGFGAPVRDPVLHIASLASTLAFPPGTQLSKVSGQSSFSVSGNTVTGALDGATNDANGTVRLLGTFGSASFTATPVFGPSTEDGIDVQVGAHPATAQPPAEPTTLADLPPPVIGRSVNVGPVRGIVLVAVPAATRAGASARTAQKGLRFVPLTEARQIPTGSFLDTRRGTVRLQSARDRAGRRQTGDFVSGIFQVVQSRRGRQRGLTELRLKGSSFRRCRVGRGSRQATTAARRRSRRVIRRLRGNARGRFRTRGRYSAATVRGTVWASVDRCDGTLTTVRRGKVVVRDFRRKRNVLLSSGRRHLARAGR